MLVAPDDLTLPLFMTEEIAMKLNPSHTYDPSLRAGLRRPMPSRTVRAAAAATMTTALLAALLLAFELAGPAQWIAPTPDVLESLARCDALRERAARQVCAQQLVAAQLDVSRRGVQVAGR
jgi:hypothetical protein